MMIPNEDVIYFNKFYTMCSKIIMLGDFSKKDVKAIQNQFDDCVKRISHQYDMKNYEKARWLMGNFLMYLQNKRIEGYCYCIHRR